MLPAQEQGVYRGAIRVTVSSGVKLKDREKRSGDTSRFRWSEGDVSCDQQGGRRMGDDVPSRQVTS